MGYRRINKPGGVYPTEIQLEQFALQNLDDMREDILHDVASTSSFIVDSASIALFGLQFEKIASGQMSAVFPLEVLS